MLTKTLSALAIILSTVSSAVAVTMHEGKAANHDMANKASLHNPRDKADFVIGNILFVGFHEMGHALADQFHLPTLGRAEDAADAFATIALLNAGSEFSINVLVQAARGLFLSDRRLRQAACIPDPKAAAARRAARAAVRKLQRGLSSSRGAIVGAALEAPGTGRGHDRMQLRPIAIAKRSASRLTSGSVTALDAPRAAPREHGDLLIVPFSFTP